VKATNSESFLYVVLKIVLHLLFSNSKNNEYHPYIFYIYYPFEIWLVYLNTVLYDKPYLQMIL